MKYLIVICTFLFLPFMAYTSAVTEMPAEFNDILNKEINTDIDIEQFLSLTPKKIKEQTGRRLTLKEVFILKRAQKKIKKKLVNSNGQVNDKSQVTALLLAMFLGFLGAHRFYLGYTFHGLLYLLTFGGCFIMVIIDLVLIATGQLQPKYGAYGETLD